MKIESKQQAVLVSKAIDDAETVRLQLFALLKFAAEVQTSPEALNELVNAIKPVERFKDNLGWALRAYKAQP